MAFLFQVPITIISVALALHLPKTEASDLMAKFKVWNYKCAKKI
jgi:hypothetical protein